MKHYWCEKYLTENLIFYCGTLSGFSIGATVYLGVQLDSFELSIRLGYVTIGILK